MPPIPGKYHHTNMEEGLTSSSGGGTGAVERVLKSLPDDVKELTITVSENPGGDYRVEYRYVKP